MQPDDERKRRKETERAIQAKAIVESPLWDEAYTGLINSALERMLAPTTTDGDTLELKRRINTVHAVKKAMETHIQTGKLAEMQLEEAKNGND